MYFKHLILLSSIATISFFYYHFTFNDQVIGLLSDDAVYLLLSELYSPWHSDKHLIVEVIRILNQFPPLFPIILGYLGADTNNPAFAAQINCYILILSIITVSLWIRIESKTLIPAITISLLIAFLPSTLILSQGLWSEFLFMFFLYSAFAISSSNIEPEKRWLATSLFLSLSTLTRSIGIAVVAAYILLLLAKRPKRFLLYIAISSFPFCLWYINRGVINSYPSYFDTLLSMDLKFNLEKILDISINHILIFSNSFKLLFSILETEGFHQYLTITVTLILFSFAMVGFLKRISILKLDALSVPFYIGVILIWPYYDTYFVSRFLYPILPLFLFYMWTGIQNFVSTEKIFKLCIAGWFLSIIFIAYPSSKQFIYRGFKSIPNDLADYRRSRNWLIAKTNEDAEYQLLFNKMLMTQLPLISKEIPLHECLYTYQAPIVRLHTKRIAYAFPPYTKSKKLFEEQSKNCKYFLAQNISGSDSSYPPFYPLEHINDIEYEMTLFHTDSEKTDKTAMVLIKRIKQ